MFASIPMHCTPFVSRCLEQEWDRDPLVSVVRVCASVFATLAMYIRDSVRLCT